MKLHRLFLLTFRFLESSIRPENVLLQEHQNGTQTIRLQFLTPPYQPLPISHVSQHDQCALGNLRRAVIQCCFLRSSSLHRGL
jgi:hypothetical protein